VHRFPAPVIAAEAFRTGCCDHDTLARTGAGAHQDAERGGFPVPIGDRYFEDYQEGAVYEYGYATTDTDELVAFARRFDPQPIHADTVTRPHFICMNWLNTLSYDEPSANVPWTATAVAMDVFHGPPETITSRTSKVALGISLKLRRHHWRTASTP
jgi:hypothetical protein